MATIVRTPSNTWKAFVCRFTAHMDSIYKAKSDAHHIRQELDMIE
jgi:hypothetical protein